MTDAATPAVEVRPLSQTKDIRGWLRVPHAIYGDDPHWVAPLDFFERRRIDPRNPFFRFADAEFFVAYRDGRPVGRISAQVNRRHLEQHRDNTGHFGFFDVPDDGAVADALLDAARDWLAARGMTRMAGPFSLSVNEECGLLVEGFGKRAAVMVPQSAPWQSGLLERRGFSGIADLLEFHHDPEASLSSFQWATDRIAKQARVTVRRFDRARLDSELDLMLDIFNAGWRTNWGFVPLSRAEVDYGVGSLRPLFRDEFGAFVMVDGKEAGFSLVLPDINAVIKTFRGRLFPFNVFRLLTAFLFRRIRSSRLVLFGLRPEFQSGSPGGLSVIALWLAILRDFPKVCPQWNAPGGEKGIIYYVWVLKQNRPLVRLLTGFFGGPVKTYRVYAREM